LLRVRETDAPAEIAGLLELDRLDPLRFRGRENEMNFSGGLYGGQMLCQGLTAAMATVEGKSPHSLHGYFLSAGDIHQPIDYQVEPTRDGASFANRRVKVGQGERLLMDMRLSFHAGEDAFVHQIDARPAPEPESLPTRQELIARWRERMTPMVLARLRGADMIDARAVDPELVYWSSRPASQTAYWARMPSAGRLPAHLHAAALTYMTDYVMTVPILLPCADPAVYRDMRLTSLDHSIWFHRPWRADDWLLFETESPVAANGRGLLHARAYARTGELVLSLAQEMLIRPRNGVAPVLARL
jgi:acyl-CoA thioesterase-2